MIFKYRNTSKIFVRFSVLRALVWCALIISKLSKKAFIVNTTLIYLPFVSPFTDGPALGFATHRPHALLLRVLGTRRLAATSQAPHADRCSQAGQLRMRGRSVHPRHWPQLQRLRARLRGVLHDRRHSDQRSCVLGYDTGVCGS